MLNAVHVESQIRCTYQRTILMSNTTHAAIAPTNEPPPITKRRPSFIAKPREHHEQNKMDDARTSAKNALAGSDKAHKQSVTAWQGSAK